jgi:hypothetical protein
VLNSIFNTTPFSNTINTPIAGARDSLDSLVNAPTEAYVPTNITSFTTTPISNTPLADNTYLATVRQHTSNS